jgi:hypothetical protein
MLPREFVNYQDRLFWIYRKVNQSKINTEYINDLKEFWYCDIVLKQKTSQNSEVLLFLREIPEATIITQT